MKSIKLVFFYDFLKCTSLEKLMNPFRPNLRRVVQELLVRSLLIGRRKQWHAILFLPIVLALFGVREMYHW